MQIAWKFDPETLKKIEHEALVYGSAFGLSVISMLLPSVYAAVSKEPVVAALLPVLISLVIKTLQHWSEGVPSIPVSSLAELEAAKSPKPPTNP